MRRLLVTGLFFAAVLPGAEPNNSYNVTDLRVVNAAQADDRAAVQALLREKVAATGAQGDGMTALHWAAYNDDLSLAQMLLRAGAYVQAKTRIGALTPLLMASRNGSPAMIRLMLSAKASPNTADANGTTALMFAATSGNPQALKLLLDAGAEKNARESAHGYTALMFAADENRPEAIRMLAQYGADLQVTALTKELKVHKLSYEDEDFPLDVEVILHNNLPPGAEAAQKALEGRRASARVIGGVTALLLAARDNHPDAVRALLDVGAPIDEQSAGDKSTPLLIAIINGHFDLASLLVDQGANVNVADEDGLTPLYATIDTQWAPLGGSAVPSTEQERVTELDLLKSLLAHGAHPDAQLKRKLWYRPTEDDQMWVGTPGSTAFWRAAEAEDLPAMRALIAGGADPKIPSEEGDTALMMAAGVGWVGNFSRTAPGPALDVVKYCADLGLSVNTQDVTGYTALAGAAWRGDNDVVKFLVAKGAALNARTARGWSVTDMADGPSLRTTVPVRHPDTVALLRQFGAPELTPHPDEEILGLKRRFTPDGQPKN